MSQIVVTIVGVCNSMEIIIPVKVTTVVRVKCKPTFNGNGVMNCADGWGIVDNRSEQVIQNEGVVGLDGTHSKVWKTICMLSAPIS
jgi:hypothetical protein